MSGASAADDVQVGIVSWGPDACGTSAASPCECREGRLPAGGKAHLSCCRSCAGAAAPAASQGCQSAAACWSATDAPAPTPTPRRADVYTDVGMVFDWVNTTVWQLTGQYLQYSSPSNGSGGGGTTTPPRPVISGFNGQRVSFPGAANSGQYVLQYPGRWWLYGRLGAGPTPGSLLVNYYQWRWGTPVIASVNSATRALTGAWRAGAEGGRAKVLQVSCCLAPLQAADLLLPCVRPSHRPRRSPCLQ